MLGNIMRPLPLLVFSTLLACCTAAAVAAPAPWFQWRSKVDGKQFCAQTSLGHGWEKAAGPFKDSRCTKLVATQ
jgi:hypothetical protein